MLNFVVTNHWYEEYTSGRKTHEYRKKTAYWDIRVKNALVEHFGKTEAEKYLRLLKIPATPEGISTVGFPKDNAPTCQYRRAYTAEKTLQKIHSICIRNGKKTDLATDDLVYDFELGKE